MERPAAAGHRRASHDGATTKSTAAQNGGHHRVPDTYWARCCHASLSPWAANPSTRSQVGPVMPAAAITTNAIATEHSRAMTLHRPSATAKPIRRPRSRRVRPHRRSPDRATRTRVATWPGPRPRRLPKRWLLVSTASRRGKGVIERHSWPAPHGPVHPHADPRGIEEARHRRHGWPRTRSMASRCPSARRHPPRRGGIRSAWCDARRPPRRRPDPARLAKRCALRC
jgi:hypothetical protein